MSFGALSAAGRRKPLGRERPPQWEPARPPARRAGHDDGGAAATRRCWIYPIFTMLTEITLTHVRANTADKMRSRWRGSGKAPSPGGRRHLLGQKDIDAFREDANLAEGIDQRPASAIRTGPDRIDLEIKIEELRKSTGLGKARSM